MEAFFACGHDTIKADGIAAMQLHALKQHYNGKLRLTDIEPSFVCSARGKRGADIRPDFGWNKPQTRMMGYR